MNSTDVYALSPFIVLALASISVMLGIAVRRNHNVSAGLGLLGLAVALALIPAVAGVTPRRITPLIYLDTYALFYMAMIFAAALVVGVFCYSYLGRLERRPEEIYILLLLSAAGAGTMAASRHFAAFYLGLEVLSVSLYAMIGYLSNSKQSTEAALKYLILAAASAAFLLFGMALVYAEVGSLEFERLADSGVLDTGNGILVAGFALMLVGVGFKLSIVPFHMWTPDVYDGAPAPVTAYIATVSKAAVFALLLHYFTANNPRAYGSLYTVFSLAAVASMFVGNLLALREDNVKRILAYSSIAHLGYASVAYLAGGAAAVEAVTYYLAAYIVTTLGAFGVISVLSTDPAREKNALEDYRGLFWARPWTAAVFAVMLLSLAGIPLTAGFVGKLYVFAAGVKGALWWQLIAVAINSAIGLYYYLRIVAMLFAPLPEGERPRLLAISRTGGAVLAALTLILLWMGTYPAPVMNWVRTLTAAAP